MEKRYSCLRKILDWDDLSIASNFFQPTFCHSVFNRALDWALLLWVFEKKWVGRFFLLKNWRAAWKLLFYLIFVIVGSKINPISIVERNANWFFMLIRLYQWGLVRRQNSLAIWHWQELAGLCERCLIKSQHKSIRKFSCSFKCI